MRSLGLPGVTQTAVVGKELGRRDTIDPHMGRVRRHRCRATDPLMRSLGLPEVTQTAVVGKGLGRHDHWSSSSSDAYASRRAESMAFTSTGWS